MDQSGKNRESGEDIPYRVIYINMLPFSKNVLEMTVLSRLMIYSMLGLTVLFSAFLFGNGQIRTFASSEASNATEITGTTEITIGDMNGTELFTGELRGPLPCWEMPEGPPDCTWGPGPGSLLDVMMMNITMKDLNGTEIMRFENITVNCSPLEGTPELAHCIQD